MTTETRGKVEQIVRMLVQGYRPSQVARMLAMSIDGLVRIRKSVEYQEIEDTVRRQNLEKMDRTLERRTEVARIRETMQEEMEEAVPEALRILMASMREKRDLRAALEVLDRDPERQFAKGSRGAQPTNVGVGVQVKIDSQALAQAVKDANETQKLMEKAAKVKPADA